MAGRQLMRRLARLETEAMLQRYAVETDNQDAVPLLSDEEEADRTGRHVWLIVEGNKAVHPRDRDMWIDPGSPAPDLALQKQVVKAMDEGHQEYHVGMREHAMAAWLYWKPGIVEHREKYGKWIPVGPPVRFETMTVDEINQLPLAEQVEILCEFRPGYWSKLGPQSMARSRNRYSSR